MHYTSGSMLIRSRFVLFFVKNHHCFMEILLKSGYLLLCNSFMELLLLQFSNTCFVVDCADEVVQRLVFGVKRKLFSSTVEN